MKRAQLEPTPTLRLFNCLIESGAIYTLALFALCIGYGVGARGLAVAFTYVLPHILALVPTLVIMELPASSKKLKSPKGVVSKFEVSWPVAIVDERTLDEMDEKLKMPTQMHEARPGLVPFDV